MADEVWTVETFLKVAGLALTSSVAATIMNNWLQARRGNKERDLTKSADVIATLMEQNQQKEGFVRDYQQQLYAALRDLEEARETVKRYELTRVPENGKSLLEGWLQTLPFPSWIHEVGRNNWFLNDSYCEVFHIVRPGFWHPVNVFASFPDELAAQFVEEDMRVLAENKPAYFEQNIPMYLREPPGPENPTIRCEVVKRPWKVDERIYLMGTARPLEGPHKMEGYDLSYLARKPASAYNSQGIPTAEGNGF